MKKLTKLEKYGLIAAIAIGVIYFYTERIYDPQAASLRETTVELTRVIGDLGVTAVAPPVALIGVAIEGRRKELEEVKSDVLYSAVKMAEEAEISEQLSSIGRLVSQNRLTIKDIVPKGEVEGDLFGWSLFELNMEGSFHSFVAFLSGLKEMPDPMKVRDINIKRSGDTLQINMTLRI